MGRADRRGEAGFGAKGIAAGDLDEVVRAAAQLVSEVGDQIVEPATFADQANQRLARHWFWRGEDGGFDPEHPFAPAFNPDAATTEFSTLLRAYGIGKVIGDRYAGESVRERFRRHGIEYQLSEAPKSDIYRDALPLFNAGRAQLLDVKRLTHQLCSLERRTARGGRDLIDHPQHPGAHDDLANAVCGAFVILERTGGRS